MTYMVAALNGRDTLYFGPFDTEQAAEAWGCTTFFAYKVEKLRAPLDLDHRLP